MPDVKPLIGITMGCPAGIGPEVCLGYFAGGAPFSLARPFVLGDLGLLRRLAGDLKSRVRPVPWSLDEAYPEGDLPVLSCSALDLARHRWGQPDATTGGAMAAYIVRAVELCLQRKIGAMVTCPVGKDTLQNAGFPFPGHTEMLGHLCGTDDFAMMMAGRSLKVALVTTHIALRDIPVVLDTGKILRLLSRLWRALSEDFGIAAPRVAVAALNPHAGEAGLFGDEEKRVILPAIREAERLGMSGIVGPLPPDTVFHKAAAGAFDAVVCMYHDQGLIPFKLLHFEDGVNVTLGLPIVRTSVDHGTAYDISGRGMASPASLAAAVAMAADICGRRRQAGGVRSETA